ncbi:MotA/TolQ/ExbB proton channel family protein [Quisquiliibacterium transsilvanicum]|uniref:Biopolymer transport protein ExbB n=1 Tax=Quisquiliibacterium transsilvanicum TaxID=1549638 RepID=A0A7W8HGS4_9BURK|nr:MotA/TolQ/ExbB proton channel family protein [Quisquiliibacterium transsilvanicum]MBB5271787.1 biopolymer transport protein ExbB [Quisquiliibacterium transsilvanicum]
MSTELGFANFLAQSDGVARFILAVMLLMSLGSWFLIFRKGARALAAGQRSRRFLQAFWDAPSLEAVRGQLREDGPGDPFSNLVRQGFVAVEQHRRRDEARRLVDAGTSDEFLTRALKRSIGEDVARLESGQTFLATVASTAPFVGLLGTVWGIYHALVAIGAAGDAGLDKVAGPVGEALIMTGLGLAVAIPAAVAYNFFARSNRRVRAALESFAYDVFAFLGTGAKGQPAPVTDLARERARTGARPAVLGEA